jgi:hypothetical protein
MDAKGNLYGTTLSGGIHAGCGGPTSGTVFELTPPLVGGGIWSESVLWSFGGASDGASPYSSLLMDPNGNLYGTTAAGGAHGGSTAQGTTNLIGGTVFKLMPPASGAQNWSESVLWSFGG